MYSRKGRPIDVMSKSTCRRDGGSLSLSLVNEYFTGYQLLKHASPIVMVVPEIDHFVRLRQAGIPVLYRPGSGGEANVGEAIKFQIDSLRARRAKLKKDHEAIGAKEPFRVRILVGPLWHEDEAGRPLHLSEFQKLSVALQKTGKPDFGALRWDYLYPQERAAREDAKNWSDEELKSI